MKCEKCKAKLNHKAVDAKQGSMISCPLCGQETRVKYSLLDSLTDPSAIPFGNLKYASRRLSKAWIVAFFAFFTLLIVVLIAAITGQVKITE